MPLSIIKTFYTAYRASVLRSSHEAMSRFKQLHTRSKVKQTKSRPACLPSNLNARTPTLVINHGPPLCVTKSPLSASRSYRYTLQIYRLWRKIVLDDLSYFPLVRLLVFLEQIVGVCLRGRIRVHLVQQHLDPEQNLLDRDRWFPCLIFV